MRFSLDLSLWTPTPPADAGGSPGVTSLAAGPVDWGWDAAVQAGRLPSGQSWFVGAADVLEPTPAASTIGADAVHGSEHNPPATGLHPFDERDSQYDALLAPTYPLAMAVGDTLLKAVGAELIDANTRSGVIAQDGWQSLIRLASPPPSNAIGYIATKWAGRGAASLLTVNRPDATTLSELLDLIPSRTISGLPPLAEVTARIRYFPILSRAPGPLSTGGYQLLMPQRFGGEGSGNRNFGRSISIGINAAYGHIMSDANRTGDNRAAVLELLAVLIVNGAEWFEAISRDLGIIESNGAHYSWINVPPAFYLWSQGREDEVADLVDTVGANWRQYFPRTPAQIDDEATHTSANLPLFARERTISAVSGNNITFPRFSGGTGTNDPTHNLWTDMKMVRVSDGAAAIVTVNLSASNGDPYQVTIDAQPTPAFAVSDVIRFDYPDGVSPSADWLVASGGPVTNAEFGRGTARHNPSPEQGYREQQPTAIGYALLKSCGAWPEDLYYIEDYIEGSNAANFPAADFDWPATTAQFPYVALPSTNYSWEGAFWTAHGASILALDNRVPGKPTFIADADWAAAPAGPGEIDVTVDALPDDGGSALTEIEYTVDGGSTWLTLTLAPAVDIFTITGLTGGDTYPEVALRFVNANGTGPRSAFKSATAGAANIAVTSGSVRFPARNIAEASSANMSYIAVPNFAPSGNAIFNASGAMMCRVMLPLAGYIASGPWQKPVLWIAGNHVAGTLNNSFGFSVVPSATPETAPHSLRSFYRTAAGTRNDVLDLPLGNDPVVALLVMRNDGTNLVSELYIGGVLIDSVSGAAFAGGSILRSALILGGCNSGTGTTPAAPTGTFGYFDGMTDFFGYTDSIITQADCEAISAGADPQVQIATWRWGIAPTDPTLASYPAFGTAAALRGPGTRVGTLEIGSDLAPGVSGATRFSVDPIVDGMVWCVRGPGFTQGRVQLSGLATGLSGNVEARIYDRTDGRLVRDWAPLTGVTLTGGTNEAWSGYLDSPVNIGWAGVDVRPASTPAMARRSLARHGVGYDLAGLGQSQVARSLGTGFNSLTPSVPASAAIGYALKEGTGLFCATDISTHRRMGDGPGYAAEYLHNRMGGVPCRIVALAAAGTGFNDLMDDSRPARSYADLVAIVQRAGSTALSIALDWGSENLAAGSNFGPAYLAPLYEGATPTEPFDSAGVYTRNNWLGDGQLGIPLYYGFTGLSTHVSTGAGPFNANVTGGQGAGAAVVRAATLAYAIAQGHSTGPTTTDYLVDAGEASHQEPTSRYGHGRHAIRLVECALRALGSENGGDPVVTGVTRSGANLDVTVALARWTASNGARLQTGWTISGFSPPANWPVVQGFEVNEGGGWSNGNSQTGTAPVVFTASIIDDGASDGTAVVRLVRSTGTWAAGTQVRYCYGGPLDYGQSTLALELIHGLLYEGDGDGLGDDGQLAGEGGIGLPVLAGWSATAA